MDGRTNRGYWCGGAFPWWQEGQEISRDCVAVAFSFLQYVAIAFAQFYIVFPRLRGLRYLCLTARALTSSHQLSQVKWVEGVFEKESKSSDFPTIILDSLISLQLSHAVSLYCLSWRSWVMTYICFILFLSFHSSISPSTEGFEQGIFRLALLSQGGIRVCKSSWFAAEILGCFGSIALCIWLAHAKWKVMSAVRGMISEGEVCRADLPKDQCCARSAQWISRWMKQNAAALCVTCCKDRLFCPAGPCAGGSKEALAAIYALRQRSTITGQLDVTWQLLAASHAGYYILYI